MSVWKVLLSAGPPKMVGVVSPAMGVDSGYGALSLPCQAKVFEKKHNTRAVFMNGKLEKKNDTVYRVYQWYVINIHGIEGGLEEWYT